MVDLEEDLIMEREGTDPGSDCTDAPTCLSSVCTSGPSGNKHF